MQYLFRIIALCGLTLVLIACIKEEPISDDIITVGQRLPVFSLEMNNGQHITNDSLKGKVSLIMFFHTGCPDCRQTLPHVQHLYDEIQGKGVEFVLISREEEEESISTYWQENGLSMPYSAQTNRIIYEKFARNRVPRIYINDRYGIVKNVFTDNPIPTYNALNEALGRLL